MTDNICSICFDEIEDKSILNCKHEFCNHCLLEWLNTNNFNCPLCRINIDYYHHNNNIIRIISRNINERQRINHPVIFIRTIEIPIIRYYLLKIFSYLFLFYFLLTITIISDKMDVYYYPEYIKDNEYQNETKLILNDESYDNLNYSCIMECL